jgi:carbonic anhydrase
MSVTGQYLENNKIFAANFQGPLPLPPSKRVAVLACMDANSKQSPCIVHKDSVRGFVFDVATGLLREVIST